MELPEHGGAWKIFVVPTRKTAARAASEPPIRALEIKNICADTEAHVLYIP